MSRTTIIPTVQTKANQDTDLYLPIGPGGSVTIPGNLTVNGSGVTSINGSVVSIIPTSGDLQISSDALIAPPRVRMFDYLNGGSIKYDSTNGLEINTEAEAIRMTPATGLVEIKGDTTNLTSGTLRFTDNTTTVATVDMAVRNDTYGYNYPELASTSGLFSVSSGAVEGISIGTNGTQNVVIGYGLPLKIANNNNLLPTDYIMLEDAGPGTGKVTIKQNAEVNIETPLLTFTGAGLQSNTSGGSSGQYLVINLNGVVYKIQLQNA